MYTWQSEDSLQEWVLSFCLVGSRDHTQDVMPGHLSLMQPTDTVTCSCVLYPEGVAMEPGPSTAQGKDNRQKVTRCGGGQRECRMLRTTVVQKKVLTSCKVPRPGHRMGFLRTKQIYYLCLLGVK